VTDLLHDLRKAIETGDAELWSSLHSDDFEQTELWDSSHPPSNPRKRNREEVAEAVGLGELMVAAGEPDNSGIIRETP
jgi:hypothetical protein